MVSKRVTRASGVMPVPEAGMQCAGVRPAETAEACIAREEKESRFREALLQGNTTWEMLNLNALMESKGSPFRL